MSPIRSSSSRRKPQGVRSSPRASRLKSFRPHITTARSNVPSSSGTSSARMRDTSPPVRPSARHSTSTPMRSASARDTRRARGGPCSSESRREPPTPVTSESPMNKTRYRGAAPVAPVAVRRKFSPSSSRNQRLRRASFVSSSRSQALALSAMSRASSRNHHLRRRTPSASSGVSSSTRRCARLARSASVRLWMSSLNACARASASSRSLRAAAGSAVPTVSARGVGSGT
mmetsp:Transcript_20100/g.59923  ORF Transcript_20100/g.59923 Transcript_20100/m.59923 type:complete len:230 (+) Transcript_20100:399-1088(+)